MIEKNEQKRIREVMAQNTPKKTKSSEEQEIQTLKEEIKTKTGNILDQSIFFLTQGSLYLYKCADNEVCTDNFCTRRQGGSSFPYCTDNKSLMYSHLPDL